MKTATAIENQVNRVSKKVYADIVSRVNNTLKATLRKPDIIPEAIQAIDEYIANGTIPTPKDGVILIVFYMIKPEIDRAAERSRRARERAAIRREKLQAAKSAALKYSAGLIPSDPKTVPSPTQSTPTALPATPICQTASPGRRVYQNSGAPSFEYAVKHKTKPRLSQAGALPCQKVFVTL